MFTLLQWLAPNPQHLQVVPGYCWREYKLYGLFGGRFGDTHRTEIMLTLGRHHSTSKSLSYTPTYMNVLRGAYEAHGCTIVCS